MPATPLTVVALVWVAWPSTRTITVYRPDAKPVTLREGETLDFWRVDRVAPGHMLRLRAEMRLPGDAYLQWEIDPVDGGSDLVQTAIFRPRGLLGRAYWYLMAPFHSLLFPRMARKMAAAAEERGYSCPD